MGLPSQFSRGRRLGFGEHEHDIVPFPYDAFPQNPGIQAQAAAESAAYVTKHLRIARQGVRIDRGHRASPAQRIEAHDCRAYVEFAPWPRSLLESLHARDYKVRTQPPYVSSKRRGGAVGDDQERRDIEALVYRRSFEPRILSCCIPYVGKGGGFVPRPAIHERPAVNIERAAQAQQSMVPA